MAAGPERDDNSVVVENERLRVENERLTSEVDRLAGENAELRSTVDSFGRKIASLEKRLGKNSENSSLPPSSDLFGRKKDKSENANRAARRALGRKPGKQPGTEGKYLAHVDDPDDVQVHTPPACDGCGADLAGAPVEDTEVRQVTDIPVPVRFTIEYRGLWEQSELARAESEGDYAWLNAAALWGLHSSLDALVEQNSPAVASLASRIRAQDLVNQAAPEQPELVAQLPDGALEQIAQAAAALMTKDFKVIKPRGNRAVRWEGPLGTVGLDAPEGRPIPPAMDQALAELCILRDVLSHRGGRVDQKAADDWPCGTLEVGSFVPVSQNQVRRYSAAVGAFGAEICRRLLARFSVPVDVNLDNWEQHGFLI
jgi:hypothetical protein